MGTRQHEVTGGRVTELPRRAPEPPFEGFIAAKVLVEGLRRAGRDLTRDKLVAALETMNDFDVGGFTVTYTPSDHSGSRFVELTAIGKDGAFVR